MRPTTRPTDPTGVRASRCGPVRSTGPGIAVLAAGLLLPLLAGCASGTAAPGEAAPSVLPSASAAAPVPTDLPVDLPTPLPTDLPTELATEVPRDESTSDLPVLLIDDFAYQVPTAVVPGATVQVRNTDVETHTVTSSPAGSFAVSVPVDGSGTFVAPATPGAYEFVCLLHGGMSGVLVVG